MSRYRDVKDVSIFGTAWTGVQEVSLNFEADTFENSGDDDTDIKRVDVTKQKITISVDVLDPNHKRDIKTPIYGASPGLSLNEVVRISLSENCDVISDSAEEDQWITYIGVTRRKIEGEVEMRDISQLMTEGTIKIGDKDDLIFKTLPGATLTGLADGSAYEEFTAKNMVVTGIAPSARHGEIGNGTISFIGHGDDSNEAEIQNTLSAGGNSGFEKHCGDSGTILWTAPSVGGSGGDVDVTIVNCVCTGVELVANHGGRLERRFTFEAYSSDGETSPISIA